MCPQRQKTVKRQHLGRVKVDGYWLRASLHYGPFRACPQGRIKPVDVIGKGGRPIWDDY
jgi:hypothetical protein